MNVKDIDFERLLESLEDNADCPKNEDIELANKILFGYSVPNKAKGDFVFVAGNPKCLEDRIVKGVELIKKGFADKIIVSGGVLIPESDKTEAEAMQEYCLENGIENVIVENKSTTTVENIEYTAEIIQNSGISAPVILAVTSAHHMRRVLMDFEKQKNMYPEGTTVIPFPSVHPDCIPDEWHKSEEAVYQAMKELGLISYYLFLNNYNGFEI